MPEWLIKDLQTVIIVFVISGGFFLLNKQNTKELKEHFEKHLDRIESLISGKVSLKHKGDDEKEVK